MSGENLYDAALRQRVSFPVSCRNGNCLCCTGRLLRGICRDSYQDENIYGHQSDKVELLLCKAVPKSDCDIAINGVLGPGELPLQIVTCRVQKIEKLSAFVFRVFLLPQAGKKINFYAGQYLSIHLPAREPSFFSIASSPSEKLIELHIQAVPGWTSAEAVIKTLQENDLVSVELPFGKACLEPALLKEHRISSLVLIAAGTGFSQMKSIINTLLERGDPEQIHLFWGVRKNTDMYLPYLPEVWKQKHSSFHFNPVFGDDPDNEWSGHHVQLWKSVIASGVVTQNSEIFISGSPDMVYSTMQGLMDAGATAKQFHSDVFEYAPQNS